MSLTKVPTSAIGPMCLAGQNFSTKIIKSVGFNLLKKKEGLCHHSCVVINRVLFRYCNQEASFSIGKMLFIHIGHVN